LEERTIESIFITKVSRQNSDGRFLSFTLLLHSHLHLRQEQVSSVEWQTCIDLFRPGVDAAFEVFHLLETGACQQL
jgi:hypothetical protein